MGATRAIIAANMAKRFVASHSAQIKAAVSIGMQQTPERTETTQSKEPRIPQFFTAQFDNVKSTTTPMATIVTSTMITPKLHYTEAKTEQELQDKFKSLNKRIVNAEDTIKNQPEEINEKIKSTKASLLYARNHNSLNELINIKFIASLKETNEKLLTHLKELVEEYKNLKKDPLFKEKYGKLIKESLYQYQIKETIKTLEENKNALSMLEEQFKLNLPNQSLRSQMIARSASEITDFVQWTYSKAQQGGASFKKDWTALHRAGAVTFACTIAYTLFQLANELVEDQNKLEAEVQTTYTEDKIKAANLIATAALSEENDTSPETLKLTIYEEIRDKSPEELDNYLTGLKSTLYKQTLTELENSLQKNILVRLSGNPDKEKYTQALTEVITKARAGNHPHLALSHIMSMVSSPKDIKEIVEKLKSGEEKATIQDAAKLIPIGIGVMAQNPWPIATNLASTALLYSGRHAIHTNRIAIHHSLTASVLRLEADRKDPTAPLAPL